jgi:replication initiation protein RepC
MTIASVFQSLPAHPRHLSEAADRFRERFASPPKLEGTGLAPGNIIATFKAAARYMKLRPNVVQAMDYFFALTQPQDWVADARPIVWPSAREQAEALTMSISGVKRLNRQLIDLGLVLAKDSPTGARWGRRSHNGQIIEAYGFDLSPMGHRLSEFAAIRDAGRADDVARAQLRRRKTVAMQSIGQVVRTAAERDLDTPALYELADQARTITRGLPALADRPTLTQAVDELERVAEAVLALYRRMAAEAGDNTATSSLNSSSSAMQIVNHDPARSSSEPPNNNYKPTYNPSDCNSSEKSSSDFGDHRALPEAEKAGKRRLLKVPDVRPKEVVRLAPRIGSYLSEDLERLDMSRAIQAVMRAAETCAFQGLGVSRPLWAQAQAVMGVWEATLAVMVVAAKDENYFTRTPAHYFAGMVERAKDGTLRLDRSIFGMWSKDELGKGGRA